MSTTKRRLPLGEARDLADEIAAMLEPYCERVEVAGSIRRERPGVGDLELVVIPRLECPTQMDLFGERVVEGPPVNLLDKFVDVKLGEGVFEHRRDKNGRSALGERFKRLSYRGVALDLFAVLPPAQWGVIFLIRTGSADFSHRFVTPHWRHAWSQDGRDLGDGWMPAMHIVKDGGLWLGAKLLQTPDEMTFFEQVGKRYVEPADREIPVPA